VNFSGHAVELLAFSDYPFKKVQPHSDLAPGYLFFPQASGKEYLI